MIIKYLGKCIVVLVGSTITALGIVIFIKGNLGVDPVSTFLLGTLTIFPIKLGTASQFFNVSILVLLLLVDRKVVGIGSIINAVTLGYMINLISAITYMQETTIPIVLSVLLGPMLVGIGVGIYLSVNFGAGALEGLMIFLANKKQMSLKKVRIILDGSLVAIGLLLGAVVGIGSIIGVLLIGPVIELTLKMINKLTV